MKDFFKAIKCVYAYAWSLSVHVQNAIRLLQLITDEIHLLAPHRLVPSELNLEMDRVPHIVSTKSTWRWCWAGKQTQLSATELLQSLLSAAKRGALKRRPPYLHSALESLSSSFCSISGALNASEVRCDCWGFSPAHLSIQLHRLLETLQTF